MVEQNIVPATEENHKENSEKTKFCKHCGGKISEDAVICTLCGRQVEELKTSQSQSPNIIINNANSNVNTNNNVNNINSSMMKTPKNKWVSVILCFFLGVFGGHKFYEGKIGMGVLYFFTGGLFVIGALIDLIVLLFKPNPYYI